MDISLIQGLMKLRKGRFERKERELFIAVRAVQVAAEIHREKNRIALEFYRTRASREEKVFSNYQELAKEPKALDNYRHHMGLLVGEGFKVSQDEVEAEKQLNEAENTAKIAKDQLLLADKKLQKLIIVEKNLCALGVRAEISEEDNQMDDWVCMAMARRK